MFKKWVRFSTLFQRTATRTRNCSSYFQNACAGVGNGRRFATRSEEVLNELQVASVLPPTKHPHPHAKRSRPLDRGLRIRAGRDISALLDGGFGTVLGRRNSARELGRDFRTRTIAGDWWWVLGWTGPAGSARCAMS